MHARIIDETGGLHGIRDTGLLVSLTERPKTSFGKKEMYPGIFEKAAVYLESLARYHVFIDGNKRTGIATSARFLSLNGYMLNVSNKEMERFVLRMVQEKPSLETIAVWFKRYTIKIK